MGNTYDVFAFGHDFGNSETCCRVTGRGHTVELRIPSVTSAGSWQRVLATARGAGKEVKDILAVNHHVLEYDIPQPDGTIRRIEKNVGQKVFDDGDKPQETKGDSSRYWMNNYNLEMLLVGSASLIPDPEFGVHVVTGLPISLYLNDSTNADKVQQALVGTHRFRLNGQDRMVHVESAKCIMEGAGALIAYGSDETVLQGVIDIGGHTTDLFAAMGQKPRPAQCKGIPMGVAAATERFSEKFRAAYGYTLSLEARKELFLQHIRHEAYRTTRDQHRNLIPDDRLHGLIESALREVGQEIATAVAAAWDDVLMEMHTILIVGGGAHYFSEDIQTRFSHAKKSHRPEMANVAGYTNLAEAIAARARIRPLGKDRTA